MFVTDGIMAVRRVVDALSPDEAGSTRGFSDRRETGSGCSTCASPSADAMRSNAGDVALLT